ncbi:MAG: CRISPR-associated endonuclease Cas1 [Phycisphaeraceae bacterium]|nr:MAG: CRISPR-associated endonuclease Cas1 [Phycisphaeraceae bacterium]
MPTPGTLAPDPDRPRTVRSLALASHTLALTATLDLAEITGQPFAGGVAVPVEYRKGRPCLLDLVSDTDAELEPGQPTLARAAPWPTDRVQVGLQAILLEEAGYTVPHAVLYYAQTRTRLTIPVDDALRADALAELDAAIRTAAGPRPLPLVDDPKCPRCSLQPICLPDEINHQRRAALTIEGRSADDTISPRRIWPPRDDGIHAAVQAEGVRIGVRGAALRLTDRDGAPVRDIPIASLESLAVVGSVQLSTQALHVLADHAVPVVFMTAAGRCVAWIDPPTPTSALTRAAQAVRCAHPPARLELARTIIAAKITNQRTLLMRNAPDTRPADLSELTRCVKAAEHAASIDELLGHEGQAAAVYFGSFHLMLRDEAARAAFSANGRKRRPPPDPVNAALSFAYALLTHECVSALRTASLEPTLGFLHATRPGKPALALDLMEPFRPLIADSVVLALFNRAEVGPGHFLHTAAGCALTDHGRRALFNAWGRRMATEITHPVFDYRLAYRRMLMLHARLIAAWCCGEAPTLAFLTTR